MLGCDEVAKVGDIKLATQKVLAFSPSRAGGDYALALRAYITVCKFKIHLTYAHKRGNVPYHMGVVSINHFI